MVFKGTTEKCICRACHGNSDIYNPVIRNCSDIFLRTCNPSASRPFNNKTDTIILSTDGTCDIKSSACGESCTTGETCSNCNTRDTAIKRYKENNFLQ